MTLFGGLMTSHLAGFQNIILAKQVWAQVLSRHQTLRGLLQLLAQRCTGLGLARDHLGHPLSGDPNVAGHLDL